MMKNDCCAAMAALVCLVLAPGIIFAGELLSGLEKDIASVVSQSKPFVVRITTERKLPGMEMMEGIEDLFPHESRSGAGFIFEQDGHILTTENVTSGGGRIIVTLSDGRQFEGRIVGADPDIDVALLKIEADNLKSAQIGDSDKIVPGSWAICIGHPFGLSETATFGIISGKGRSGLGICAYEDFLQLDASINPGDSGGPVVNSRGEVIGIMAAALSEDWPFGPRPIRGPGDAFPTTRTRSISFAVPINMAMESIGRLKDKGKVERAWLGVHIQPVTPAIAKQMGLAHSGGAIVVTVVGGGPALKAGIEKGDVIMAYRGKKLHRASDLPYLVSLSPIGEPVQVDIIRGEKKVVVKPILKERPHRGEVKSHTLPVVEE